MKKEASTLHAFFGGGDIWSIAHGLLQNANSLSCYTVSGEGVRVTKPECVHPSQILKWQIYSIGYPANTKIK